jgi:hypothetical protein
MPKVVHPSIGCAAAGTSDQPVQRDHPGQHGMEISEGVQGQVTTPDGHPIAGALVQAASRETASSPIPDLAILTRPTASTSGRCWRPAMPSRC